MRQRALTTEETKRIEEKLEELIVTAKGIGDREIDRQLADFICEEFGLPRDRAEATAKAYGDSWMQEALSICAKALRLRLADRYPNEHIPALRFFEELESDVHDDKPLTIRTRLN